MDPEVCHDEFGNRMLVVRAEHLRDFPKLISWIRDQGFFSNILKLRLHNDDRRDDEVLNETLSSLRETLKKKVVRKKGTSYVYNPNAQLFYRASVQDSLFEYMNAACTAQERNDFVQTVTNKSSYEPDSNCCTELLKSKDKELIRKHLFDSVGKIAPLNESVRINEEKWQDIMQGDSSAPSLSSFPEESSPIIYGAGIQLPPNKHIYICENFSLSSLKTVIDDLDEKFDGIAFPYVYCGVKHSAFPWHIEDGGLYSINYLFAGRPKVWFGVPSAYFGLVDKIAAGLRIRKGHTSCRALLVDHKALLADPDYFSKTHGIPYSTIIQEVGDFIITPPFSLHSGFNVGTNGAFASNFGDVPWIEWGIYAPVCECRKDQVNFNLVPILRKWRPDLLEKYLRGSCLDFPPGHPCNILITSDQDQKKPKTSTTDCTSAALLLNDPGCGLKPMKTTLKSRVLQCPICPRTYAENKLNRLKAHICKYHDNDQDRLIREVEAKYPKWKPKTPMGFSCTICKASFRGSVSHVLKHHHKQHPSQVFVRKPLQ